MADNIGGNGVLQDSTGNAPVLTADLEVENRTISNVDQAFSVCETMVNDWKKGILNSARITAKLNGERPYNQAKLKNAGKDWKTNISTGFLATECSKIAPRFFMPIKTAKYLTAAQLPADHPNGEEKTAFFRQTITEAVRSWPKFNFYTRGAAREVVNYGFCFNFWPDKYDWRPTLMRMDRGFIPQGTELLEEPQFFMAKWDYKPSELLSLLRDSVEAGREEWKQDNVVQAINNAYPPPVDATYPEARKYEELIREATWGYNYTKGAKIIRTWHLFSKEATGKVSHYVLLADSGGTSSNGSGSPGQQKRLLYEALDQYDSMADVMNSMVFEYGDGTVHGAWGAAQILYDLSVQVEKVRCDAIDNIRLTNKIKANVPDAKNVNDVKLVVNDSMVIVSGAQFSGNTAGMPVDVNGYEQLDMKLTRIAEEKIGAFVPPIPLQPSDIKAAQINAAMSQQKELQEALLENWLIQWAYTMKTITRRLCDPESTDEVARGVVERLLTKLTAEEIAMLASQFPVQSVMDFTEYKAQQRAAFAVSVVNNPLFKQSVVARVMAEAAGDETFVKSITIPEGDQTDVLTAQRAQTIESAAMDAGKPIPVVQSDNDWVHMQTLKPDIAATLDTGNVQVAEIKLNHYAGHWQAGVAKKTIPPDQINAEKSFIDAVMKNIEAQKEATAIQQRSQQAMAEAEAQAQQLVASGQV